MLAQGFGVEELEAVGGEPFDDSQYVRDLPAREDVFVDEIADAAAEAIPARPVMRDAVVEHQPAGLEDAPDLAEVARVVGNANVLEHADTGDLVEKPIFGQVEVIEQLHADAAAETQLGDFRLDVIVLDVLPVAAPAAEPRSRTRGESIATVRDAADQRFRDAENAACAAAEVDIVANVRPRERPHFRRRKRLQALPRAGVHIDLGSLRQRNAVAVGQNEGDGDVAAAVAVGDDFLQWLVHARRTSTDEFGAEI